VLELLLGQKLQSAEIEADRLSFGIEIYSHLVDAADVSCELHFQLLESVRFLVDIFVRDGRIIERIE
jgi:hypothetical protein